MLCNYLWNTQCLGMPAEYFNPMWSTRMCARLRNSKSNSDDADAPTKVEPFDPVSYCLSLIQKRSGPNGVLALKFANASHFMQFQNAGCLSLLINATAAKKFSLIYVTRRDVVAQAVSIVFARKTGNWFHFDSNPKETGPYNEKALDMTLKAVRTSRRWWKKTIAHLSQSPDCCLCVNVMYEDMLVSRPPNVASLSAGTKPCRTATMQNIASKLLSSFDLLLGQGVSICAPQLLQQQKNRCKQEWVARYKKAQRNKRRHQFQPKSTAALHRSALEAPSNSQQKQMQKQTHAKSEPCNEKNESTEYMHALDYILRTTPPASLSMSREAILNCHAQLFKNLESKEKEALVSFRPGQVRINEAIAGLSVFPDHRSLSAGLDAFVCGFEMVLNRQDLSPSARAGWTLYNFLSLHPFCDGNGRVARILAKWMLLASGVPALVVDRIQLVSTKTKRGKYIRAILRGRRSGGESSELALLIHDTILCHSTSTGTGTTTTTLQATGSFSTKEGTKVEGA